jgi:hypothetical protein
MEGRIDEPKEKYNIEEDAGTVNLYIAKSTPYTF